MNIQILGFISSGNYLNWHLKCLVWRLKKGHYVCKCNISMMIAMSFFWQISVNSEGKTKLLTYVRKKQGKVNYFFYFSFAATQDKAIYIKMQLCLSSVILDEDIIWMYTVSTYKQSSGMSHKTIITLLYYFVINKCTFLSFLFH